MKKDNEEASKVRMTMSTTEHGADDFTKVNTCSRRAATRQCGAPCQWQSAAGTGPARPAAREPDRILVEFE